VPIDTPFRIGGVPTNIEFLQALLRHPDLVANDIDTNFALTLAYGGDKRVLSPLRPVIPEMLRNIPKLVAELTADDNEALDHVH
jgi:hypothetical protein